jgi:hypothetical protein
VVVVDVEAGQFDERDAFVDDRVRLARQHLDVVPEIDQRLAEVSGVDALPAHVGLAPVGQVGDPQGSSGPGTRLVDDPCATPVCITP